MSQGETESGAPQKKFVARLDELGLGAFDTRFGAENAAERRKTAAVAKKHDPRRCLRGLARQSGDSQTRAGEFDTPPESGDARAKIPSLGHEPQPRQTPTLVGYPDGAAFLSEREEGPTDGRKKRVRRGTKPGARVVPCMLERKLEPGPSGALRGRQKAPTSLGPTRKGPDLGIGSKGLRLGPDERAPGSKDGHGSRGRDERTGGGGPHNKPKIGKSRLQSRRHARNTQAALGVSRPGAQKIARQSQASPGPRTGDLKKGTRVAPVGPCGVQEGAGRRHPFVPPEDVENHRGATRAIEILGGPFPRVGRRNRFAAGSPTPDRNRQEKGGREFVDVGGLVESRRDRGEIQRPGVVPEPKVREGRLPLAEFLAEDGQRIVAPLGFPQEDEMRKKPSAERDKSFASQALLRESPTNVGVVAESARQSLRKA